MRFVSSIWYWTRPSDSWQRYTWVHCRDSVKSGFAAGNLCKAMRNLLVRFRDVTCIHLFCRLLLICSVLRQLYWACTARLHCNLIGQHEACIPSLTLLTRLEYLGDTSFSWRDLDLLNIVEEDTIPFPNCLKLRRTRWAGYCSWVHWNTIRSVMWKISTFDTKNIYFLISLHQKR